jgi:hypothetical protein
LADSFKKELLGMDDFQLHVELDSYVLHLDGQVVSTLDGGAAALMSGAAAQLREIDIENAIERSEEWLMPFSKSFQGRVLRIRDATGRVQETLGGRTSLNLQEVEQAFTEAYDAVAHGGPRRVTLSPTLCCSANLPTTGC